MKPTSSKPAACRAALASIRTQFDGASARTRLKVLASLVKIMNPRLDEVLELHDLALFAAAHPDNVEVHRAAERAVIHLGRIAEDLIRQSAAAARALRGSGLPGATTDVPFGLPLLRWFAREFPADIDFTWKDAAATEAALESLSDHLTQPAERDGLFDERTSMRSWLDLARGNRTGLVEVLRRLDACAPDHGVTRTLFESSGLGTAWRISDARDARTRLRFPRRPVFLHEDGLLKGFDVAAHLQAPISRGRLLRGADAKAMIRVARLALGVRGRETDPVTHANPAEVWLYSLERGVDIAVFGMLPQERLPIESFFGFLVAKNRIPSAYGGGWTFFNRCEIGINVFPEMRGGESVFAFAQVLRLYRHLFDVGRFTVDPFQFGADNEEAIASGAFWFYRRFGFEPVDPDLRDLAAKESRRIRSNPAHRTSAGVLRRLATTKLALDVFDDPLETPDLPTLGLAVTRAIARRFGGDLERARRESRRRVMRSLSLSETAIARWPAPERVAFEQLSLVAGLIEDLPSWPAEARSELVELLRAKGGRKEADYARRNLAHDRWRQALQSIVDRESSHSQRARR